MTKILLTGFEPFGGATRNSSAEVIRWIEDQSLTDVFTEILPVEYENSARRLVELITEIEPEIVLALGQAEGRSKISLERVAINLDDAQIADNAGEMRSESEIRKDGARAYFTAVPLRNLLDHLKPYGFPIEISLSAGSFVCNHIFYEALHHLGHLNDLKNMGKAIWMDFIHLPLVEEQGDEFPGKPVVSIELQGRVILAIIDEVKKLYLANSF